MAFIPAKLQEAAYLLAHGETPPRVTPREMLRWFGAQRRGYYITRGINRALEELGIQTDPDFEAAWIDEPLLLIRRQEPRAEEPEHFSGQGEPRRRGTPSDPTYRISRLKEAHNVPIWVPPNCSVAEAVTLMLAHDFSQLPIMQNDRTVKGLVSWQTIGQTLVFGGRPATVQECMISCREVSEDDSLFSVIQEIIAHDCVIVRDRTRKVSGIITTADLSGQFAQLTEPFMLIGEIENHVRDVLDAAFEPELLAVFRDNESNTRECRGACDLSFGGYQRILENPERWARVGLRVDRAVFIAQLDAVRTARNEIMHFDPDGISETAISHLRRFANALRVLRPLTIN